MRIAEHRKGPSTAREATVECLSCKTVMFIKFKYGTTVLQRQEGIKDLTGLHRKSCPVGRPEDERHYSINYPRA